MTTAESVVRHHDTLPSTDRRTHSRAPLAAPVLVDGMSEWTRARLENVSVGGIGLADSGPLTVGKTVEVYFELPSGVAVEARARVVRAHRDRAGLRFLNLEHGAEVALRAHCRAAAAR